MAVTGNQTSSWLKHSELNALRRNLVSTVLGAGEQAELLLIALLAGGHVLIEGPPGLGKTSLAKALATSIECSFKRIQFTPDLLPADVLGYSLFDQGKGEFIFHEGPIFANIVLADELNRTTQRVQSALLEAMSEQQVSVDAVTRPLAPPFMVVATQNERFSAGTYPLIASQLDRFLFSFELNLPNVDLQTEILGQHLRGEPVESLSAVISSEQIVRIQAEVQEVQVAASLRRYIVELCEAVRAHKGLRGEISPRATIALMRAARAKAYVERSSAVYPDHVKEVLPAVLLHRLELRRHEHEARESLAHFLAEAVKEVAVP